MENYGKTIAELRKEKNLTQSELGQALNVTAQAVSKWENEQSQPPVDTFFEMCEFFGISIDEFRRRAAGESAAPAETTDSASEPEHAEPIESESEPAPASDVKAPEHAETVEGTPVIIPVSVATKPEHAEPIASTPASAPVSGAAETARETVTTPKKAVHTYETRANKLSVGFLIVMILAIAAGLATFISLMVVLEIDEFLPALFPFFLGYFVFSFVILIGHESVVWDCFIGAIFHSVNIPGIIFTLDTNGILFFIVYKLIIAPIVTVVVWLAFVIGGFILSLFMAGFVFPFRIPTIYRETFGGKIPRKKERKLHKKKKAEEA